MAFTPHTGFDPCDGADERVSLSTGNPLHHARGHVADSNSFTASPSLVAGGERHNVAPANFVRSFHAGDNAGD